MNERNKTYEQTSERIVSADTHRFDSTAGKFADEWKSANTTHNAEEMKKKW